MRYKQVIYGRLKTWHIECPFCKLWQFDTDFCECGANLKREKWDNKTNPEIRVEMPNWRGHISRGMKEYIYQRDEYICQYCGIHCYESYVSNSSAVTIDHIIPYTLGGSDEADNLITCCRECNGIKGSEVFESFEAARKYINEHRKGLLDQAL